MFLHDGPGRAGQGCHTFGKAHDVSMSLYWQCQLRQPE